MSEWQPIETAPKDGTWIEAWRGSSPLGAWQNPVYVRWHAGDANEDIEPAWVWPDETYDVFSERGIEDANEMVAHGACYEDSKNFTHWRPLPAPPAME